MPDDPDDALDRALTDLLAPNENDRLRATRAIQRSMRELTPELDRAVREALARESVPWIRGALLTILTEDGSALEEGITIPAPGWDERLSELDVEVAHRVINMSTRRVLHEVAAVVGRAKVAAGEELAASYPGSETARQLEFLTRVCAGLRTLTSATKVPRPGEFDLSDDLTTLARALSQEHLCPILANGPSPFIIRSDAGLLQLAVRNVVLNAIEATLSVGAADPGRPIVLTWGASAEGFHITVIDRGPGPPRLLATVRNAGVSTKEGHPGYGLATASEALRSLGGTVHIQRNDRGGATVSLVWRDAG